MNLQITESCTIPEEFYGKRVDQAVSDLLPQYSRVLIQKWIKNGQLLVDSSTVKAKLKLKGGERVDISAELEEQGEWEAEDIALDIAFEDDDLLVINKPAGLVVHPAAGNRSGTLLNGLIYYLKDQTMLPRAGIVHRLDKDTTGLMVVAKTVEAHTSLVNQLQAKTVNRRYEAVVMGEMTGGRTIELAIGRHQVQRTKMAVSDDGKDALTHIRLIKKYQHFTHVQAELETGRTHQIRVHLSHVGYPLVGDPQYGGRLKVPKGANEDLKQLLANFKRQALHAKALGLVHPQTGEHFEWQQEAPADFKALITGLEKNCSL